MRKPLLVRDTIQQKDKVVIRFGLTSHQEKLMPFVHKQAKLRWVSIFFGEACMVETGGFFLHLKSQESLCYQQGDIRN